MAGAALLAATLTGGAAPATTRSAGATTHTPVPQSAWPRYPYRLGKDRVASGQSHRPRLPAGRADSPAVDALEPPVREGHRLRPRSARPGRAAQLDDVHVLLRAGRSLHPAGHQWTADMRDIPAGRDAPALAMGRHPVGPRPGNLRHRLPPYLLTAA